MNVVSPILFLIFNRPSITAQSFARIRAAKPARLFIAADGPRPDKADDARLCEETRQVVGHVDWPCEVHTLFRERNLGCRAAVSSAITWFFDHVEEGIILEDDCVPAPSFFPYCDELLERYRSSDKIVAVGGTNHVEDYAPLTDSYFFSKYPHIWGWATWRRAWRFYDDMASWPAVRNSPSYRQWFYCSRERRYWTALFDLVYSKRLDTWDVAWVMTVWSKRGIAALPRSSLITNVGWGSEATHTREVPRYVPSSSSMPFPLRHPRQLVVDRRADRATDRRLFSGTAPGARARLLHLRWSVSKRLRSLFRMMKRTFHGAASSAGSHHVH